MARYKTLVDNPWSKKNEEVDSNKSGISFSDYPSIWQPIEEEEKLLENIVSMGWSTTEQYLGNELAKTTRALNSLTQRVKELEEHE